MENIFEILRSSFKMLLARPKLFVPKIFSAIFSSIIFIGFITGNLSPVQTIFLLPISSLFGTFTPIIVSAMVESDKDDLLLYHGLKKSLTKWKSVLALFFLTFFISLVIALATLPGILAFLSTGNNIYLALSILILISLTLVASFSMYFIPIAIIGHKDMKESFRNAFNTSRSNKKEVAILTIFSFSLLVLASVSSSFMRELSLIGFFAGRIVSSIVGTYVLVVSPKYYLEHGEGVEDED